MLCVHNTDKPYYCERCKEFFKIKTEYQEHVEKTHPDDIPEDLQGAPPITDYNLQQNKIAVTNSTATNNNEKKDENSKAENNQAENSKAENNQAENNKTEKTAKSSAVKPAKKSPKKAEKKTEDKEAESDDECSMPMEKMVIFCLIFTKIREFAFRLFFLFSCLVDNFTEKSNDNFFPHVF